MSDDIVERLFASDAASALTNEAGREIERLRAANAILQVETGAARMCVNCGTVKPADEVKRGGSLPECEHPDHPGMSACTFDATPAEAWQHWRDEAHKLRAALRPFANFAEWARKHEWPEHIAADPGTPVLGRLNWRAEDGEDLGHELYIGDFDRARAALSKAEGDADATREVGA